MSPSTSSPSTTATAAAPPAVLLELRPVSSSLKAACRFLERLADVECFVRLLELLGARSAARLSVTAPSIAHGMHTEVFWRDASGDVTPGLYASWRACFAKLHGPNLAKDARRDKLSSELASRGLEIRSDSVLCSKYIESGDLGVLGCLARLADTMAEMDFYYRETCYSSVRNELRVQISCRADEDAIDAFKAGEVQAICPSDYVEAFRPEKLSTLAKDIALREFVCMEFRTSGFDANDETGLGVVRSNMLAVAPTSLHRKLEALFDTARSEGWFTLARCSSLDLRKRLETAADEPPPGHETAAARRARLRSRANRERSRIEEALAPHINAIRLLAEDTAADAHERHDVLQFPASLSREERAFLHSLAEKLGLRHESTPRGDLRVLEVSRHGLVRETFVVPD